MTIDALRCSTSSLTTGKRCVLAPEGDKTKEEARKSVHIEG